MAEEKKWEGTTYGSSRLHNALIKALKVVDVRVFYAISDIFVVPVCLLRNPSAGIAYRYFRQRLGYSRWSAFWATYVNHCRFSETVIDKFAMYSGKKYKTKIIGYEHFDKLAKQEDGFMQLSSHIGNYEIAGYTLVAKEKDFYAVVYGGEKESVMQNRDKMFSSTNIHMIPALEDMSHLFAINNALSDGQIVSMAADRTLNSPKSLKIRFLGKEASFPLGPFATAVSRGVEVLTVNVMKSAAKAYTIYVSPLRYDRSLPKKEQMAQLADKYVSELERMVHLYPTQWYNYFEFWEK